MFSTFGLGTAGATLETMSDSEIRNRTMAILGKMFKVTIPQPTKMIVSRWGSEQFSKGAYTYVALNAKPEDFDAMVAPVGSNLYFAGEHTSKTYRGTVHGALITGRNAADIISGKSISAASSMVLSNIAFAMLVLLCTLLL